ncbi:hypothetical protein AB0E67_35215, partial [Streptomyces sp. NPDC032161]
TQRRPPLEYGKLASRKCLADRACWKPQELPSSQVTRHFLVSRRAIHGRHIGGSRLSRRSLLADVANLTARNGRLSAHITRLCQTGELEQQILDLPAELERGEDLAAARAANRELTAQLNR